MAWVWGLWYKAQVRERPDYAVFFYSLFSIGALCIVVGLLGVSLLRDATPSTEASEPVEDPDRARFMLECVLEWDLTPEECEGVLRGEAPSPVGRPGC